MEAMDNSAAEQLRSIVERIEPGRRSRLATDIEDVYAEAKAFGFDAEIIRKIVRLRKRQPHEVEEEDQLLTLYRMAVGV